MALIVYYDGECPFCSAYTRYLHLKEAVGQPVLIDVRQNRHELSRLTQLNYELDKGMVVEFQERYYAGADAMQLLSSLSTRSALFNRLNYWLLSNKLIAVILYPLLRMGRNFTLLLLHKAPLSPHPYSPLLNLFSIWWGMFLFLHMLVYFFQYGTSVYYTTIFLGLGGALLFLRPESRLLLLGVLLVGFIDAWRHMPIFSNHTIIKNFFLLAVLFAGAEAALRGRSWNEFFANIAPIGRALLLVMYIFGVFHKLNTGFLDPEVSCAVALWQTMPWPLHMMNSTWLAYIFIYGTLIIETAIFLCLLVPKWRYGGIVVGIVFHMMLALSNYAMYAPFSMLSLVLHVLFLTPAAAERILSDPWMQAVRKTLQRPLGIAGALSYLGMLAGLAWVGAYASLSLTWFFVAIPFWWLVVKHGKDSEDHSVGSVFISKKWWLNIISVAFFFSCLTPYLGLKTAQSINMFANLRLEGGVSNHLIMSGSPGPFRYLDDIVYVRDSSGITYLQYVKNQELALVYYDLLSRLSDNPRAWITYERNGIVYEKHTASNLKEDIDNTLHPKWFRKWFHFSPVDTTLPKSCALDR